MVCGVAAISNGAAAAIQSAGGMREVFFPHCSMSSPDDSRFLVDVDWVMLNRVILPAAAATIHRE